MFVGYEDFSSCVCILFIRTAKYHMKGICGGTESKTGAKREIFIKRGKGWLMQNFNNLNMTSVRE